MSLFGKVLAVLNLVALGGFLYMATVTLAARKSWAYAVHQMEIALDGLPLDKEDVDQQGKPKYQNIDETLAATITGVESITTQEEYLDHRKEELVRKLDDANVKRPKIVKLAELIVPLLQTVGEREALLACVPPEKDPERKFKEGLFDILVGRLDLYAKAVPVDPRRTKIVNLLGGDLKKDTRNDDLAKLRITFLGKDALTVGMAVLDAHFDEIKEMKDREAKRVVIAKTLASLMDVLPTDEEKKKRLDELKKQPEQREDPAKVPGYKVALGVVGVRMMAHALDAQARDLLTMAVDAGNLRGKERYLFGYEHQSIINQLMKREHDLLDARDKLATALEQAKFLESKAEQQEAVVLERTGDLEKSRDVTAKLYDRLVREQLKLYDVRLRLRDANRINQQMEQKIKLLEAELKDDE